MCRRRLVLWDRRRHYHFDLFIRCEKLGIESWQTLFASFGFKYNWRNWLIRDVVDFATRGVVFFGNLWIVFLYVCEIMMYYTIDHFRKFFVESLLDVLIDAAFLFFYAWCMRSYIDKKRKKISKISLNRMNRIYSHFSLIRRRG